MKENELYNKWSHYLDGIKPQNEQSNKELLKQLNKDNWMKNQNEKTRAEIAEKWGKLGLLDGLTGHVSDNISKLYESQSAQIVNEKGSLTDPHVAEGQEAIDLWLNKRKKENFDMYNEANKGKIILAIDMDGVIADFNKELNRLAPELELHEGEGYEERSKIVDRVCQENSGVFLRLEPMADAIEAVNKLNEKYEVHFVSTPMCELYESYAHKPEWLRKHFGDWVKKRLTLTHSKHLFNAPYLIDDRLKNGVEFFKGEHLHFGTEKYPDWDSVLKYLL